MLSIVVPCYNEEKNLPLLADRFDKALKGMGNTEVVLVNNGSTDNSAQVLDMIAKEYKFVRVATVEKNIGYGHGILTGLNAAHGSVLAFTHADMQCDPADVIKAYELFQKSDRKTMVKGQRQGRFSVLTSFFHTVAAVMFFRRFNDINGQPKLFPRELLETFENPPKQFQLDFYVQYKALKNGYKVKTVPVIFAARKHGQSKWASSFKSRIKNVGQFLSYMLRLRFKGK